MVDYQVSQIETLNCLKTIVLVENQFFNKSWYGCYNIYKKYLNIESLFDG